ncbi:MAG TPA: o-succinylbenzoate--CoA ligase [Acidobacteriota bacterium]|nr:o-succinylbenzoate--CoA ligase [Acidobacteriota bacterium]
MQEETILYPTIRHAERIPDHPALISEEASITYADLEKRIAAVAGSLMDMGCRIGDRVALAAPNSLTWAVCAHAIWRIGAVLLPLDPQSLRVRARTVLAQFTPTLILAEDDRCTELHAHLPGPARIIPIGTVGRSQSTDDRQQQSSSRAVPTTVDPTRLHSIVLTSGTTREPRGVRLTYANHLFNALGSALNLGIRTDDRWLVNLPLCHIGGLAIILRCALYGTTAVIQHGADPEETIRAITEHRVTQLSLVATTLRRLLQSYGKDQFPSWVRTVLVGGGPVGSELLREARARGLPVLPTYGMTETASQAVTLSPDVTADSLSVAGKPLPFCELEIRGDDGRALGPGQEGTIWIHGLIVAEGYWKSPDEIDRIGPDGWLETRDLGTLDADGYLTVRGRRDNVIITGGKKVSPEEVEDILTRLPQVRRAAVVGVADPEWGQAVVAIIETDSPEPSAEGIRRRLSSYLERHQIPRRFLVVAQLPTTEAGKIDRRRVRELVDSDAARALA